MQYKKKTAEELNEQSEEAYKRTWSNRMEDYSGNHFEQRLQLHRARLQAWEDNKAALDALAVNYPAYRTAEVSRARTNAAQQIAVERDQVAKALVRVANPHLPNPWSP